jgi:hypothetical protein
MPAFAVAVSVLAAVNVSGPVATATDTAELSLVTTLPN